MLSSRGQPKSQRRWQRHRVGSFRPYTPSKQVATDAHFDAMNRRAVAVTVTVIFSIGVADADAT